MDHNANSRRLATSDPRPPSVKWPKARQQTPQVGRKGSARATPRAGSPCAERPRHHHGQRSSSNHEVGGRHANSGRFRPDVPQSLGGPQNSPQSSASEACARPHRGYRVFLGASPQARCECTARGGQRQRESWPLQRASWPSRKMAFFKRTPVSLRCGRRQMALHCSSGFCPGVDETSELRRRIPTREGRAAGGACCSGGDRVSPTQVKQISLNPFARSGRRFFEPDRGVDGERECTRVVNVDGDSHRPGGVRSPVFTVCSHEFHVKREAKYRLRGVRLGEASQSGPPKLRIFGGDESQEIPSTVPASDGALGALDRGRVIAMSSDTESLGIWVDNRSGLWKMRWRGILRCFPGTRKVLFLAMMGSHRSVETPHHFSLRNRILRCPNCGTVLHRFVRHSAGWILLMWKFFSADGPQ